VPFRILNLVTDEATLRERIRQRQRDGDDPSDAGEAVLDYQLAHQDTPGEAEAACAVTIDTGLALDIKAIAASL
jgi:predicted kinase